jgi:hypothetical protein
MMKYYFFLSVSCLAIACKTPKGSTTAKDSSENLHVSATGGEENKIIFLNFLVQLEDSINDKYSFTLTGSRVASGAMKNYATKSETVIEPNYLYVDLSNDKKQSTGYLKVPDPLCTVYEYPSSGGSLEKTVIRKNSGTITIRFPHNKETTGITIYKPETPGNTLKKLYHATL